MKLEDYLTKNEISRAQFAEKIGVTEASLSRYLTGDRFPRERILKLIFEATNGAVTPSDFWEQEEPAQ